MFKRLLTLLLLIPAFCSAQYMGYEIADGARRTTIPFTKHAGYIILEVRVNKIASLRLILDTGSKYNILTNRLWADVFGCQYDKTYRIMGADRRTILSTFIIRNLSLEMGKVSARNQSFLMLEDASLLNFEETLGTPIDGILGTDLFTRFVVDIDYRRSELTIIEKEDFHPASLKRHVSLPLEVEEGYCYAKSSITLPETGTVNGRLLFDTGAGLPMLLHLHPEDTNAIKGAVPAPIGQGLGGLLEGYIRKLEKIDIPPLEIDQLLAHFQLPTRLDSIYPPERSGLLGNVFISQYHLVFDLFDSVVYMKPISKARMSESFDKSGLWFCVEGQKLNHFRVLYVSANSPAAEADIQAGDVILKFNGTPRSLLNLPRMYKQLQSKAGKKIDILIERDGQKLKRSFVLRDIF